MKFCRDLEEKMRHQHKVLDEKIKEIHKTFDEHLDKGVKESRDSCESLMAPLLHYVCISTYI